MEKKQEFRRFNAPGTYFKHIKPEANEVYRLLVVAPPTNDLDEWLFYNFVERITGAMDFVSIELSEHEQDSIKLELQSLIENEL